MNKRRQYTFLDPVVEQVRNYMFIHAEIDDFGLSVYEFRVLANVVRRGDSAKKNGCYASQTTIAKDCKISLRKTHDCLKKLCEYGLLTKRSQIHDLTVQKKKGTNIYFFNPNRNDWKKD